MKSDGRHADRHNRTPTIYPDAKGPPFSCLQSSAKRAAHHSLDERIIKIRKRIQEREERIKVLCEAAVGAKKAAQIMTGKCEGLLKGRD